MPEKKDEWKPIASYTIDPNKVGSSARCCAITKKGKQCLNKSLRDKFVCGKHLHDGVDKISDVKNSYGEDVLKKPTDPGIRKEIAKERAEERLLKVIEQMRGADDIPPIIFGKHKGEIQCIPLEVDKKGKLQLPDLTYTSEKELAERESIAKEIVEHINDQLKEQIAGVSFVALQRKETRTLKAVLKRLKRNFPKPNVRLTNRIGCIFLEIDDETIQI